MKNLANPTKEKIILSCFLLIFFYIFFQLIVGYLIPDINGRVSLLRCAGNMRWGKLPFMEPNATIISEWQLARPVVCARHSQLQDIFWHTKEFLLLMLYVVIPSYLSAGIILKNKKRK